jgi:hypothetical protein
MKNVATPEKVELKSGLQAIRQRVAYAGPMLTVADMNEAVLQEASKVHRKPSK